MTEFLQNLIFLERRMDTRTVSGMEIGGILSALVHTSGDALQEFRTEETGLALLHLCLSKVLTHRLLGAEAT